MNDKLDIFVYIVSTHFCGIIYRTYLFFLRLHIFLPLIVATVYPMGHFLAPGGNSMISNSSIKGSTWGMIDFSNTVANEVGDSSGDSSGDSGT